MTRMLTRQQVADIFNVSPETVSRWERQHIIPPALRFGATVRWREGDIFRLMEASGLRQAIMLGSAPNQHEGCENDD